MLISAALAALAVVVYAPVRHYGFINYDDALYVDNPHVRSGFSAENFRYAFTTTDVGNWNPALWLSFYADRALFDLRPGPMHVENVALHWLSAVLLLILLAQATGSLGRSAAVAALFLIHPMHVESVAWLAERKDVLSTPFLLAATLAYIRYARQPWPSRRAMWYALMLVCFALSLMVKAMGVTLPAVLLLLDYWPLRRLHVGDRLSRSNVRLLSEKLPLILIVAVFIALALRAQQQLGATTDILGFGDRLANALVAYFGYMSKLLVPIRLAVFYPHPGSWPIASVVAAGGLLLLITLAVVRAGRDRPFLLVGWFWFIGTLVPVIGLMQIGSQSMADRYSYLPSVGFFLMLVWLAADLLVRKAVAQAALAGSVLLVVALLCRQQIGHWRDSEALFAHTAAVTGDNWVADMQLGVIAYERGDYAQAIDRFQSVTRLRPRDARGYFNLANALAKTNPGASLPFYRQAIELNPRLSQYHLNLAAALTAIGCYDQAQAECEKALRLNANDASALTALADITARKHAGGERLK